MAADTIPARLFALSQREPEATAYCTRVDGRWRATRWKDYARDIRRAARALIALGVGPGATTGILGFNRPEWTTFHLATMATGGAPAGIYTTCSADEVQYILAHAECAVALLENAVQWEKVAQHLEKLPALKQVVLMLGASVDHPKVIGWEAFLALGDDVEEKRLDERVEALEPSGLASLIYTSGTTGPPKGVMLSHENVAWTAKTARALTDARFGDVMLSYLPLSHIAEQMLSIHGAVTIGITIYFAESIEKVPDNLKDAQPTIFFGVPRIWEKFHVAVRGKLREATGAKARIVAWARDVATRANALKDRSKPLPTALALQYRLADKLFFSKLKPAVGLGRARVCVSGAAPVGKAVLEFFSSIDLPVREVYGQSEDTGPTSFNFPNDTKLGTVGKALPGLEVKIADDGEILVKGPNVFLGYYKDPAATEATLKDGWLHSGDLGAFDADGFLGITGRKKEILITSGGKNITPKNIEEDLKRDELIAEAVLIGDRRHYLSALLVVSPEGVAKLAKERGLDASAVDRPHESDAVRAAVQRIVDDVNSRLARVETVKKFHILPRPLAQEHGELTPTLKIKRTVVYRNWAQAIEAMYTE